jgi:hypothetical protein
MTKAVVGFGKYGSKFNSIAMIVRTKSPNQCTVFYDNFKDIFKLDTILGPTDIPIDKIARVMKECQLNSGGHATKVSAAQIPHSLSAQLLRSVTKLITEYTKKFPGDPRGWNKDEMLKVAEGLGKFGRDFVKIGDLVGTKNRQQCKDFYDNYKRKFNMDAITHSLKKTVDISQSAPMTTHVSTPVSVAATSAGADETDVFSMISSIRKNVSTLSNTSSISNNRAISSISSTGSLSVTISTNTTDNSNASTSDTNIDNISNDSTSMNPMTDISSNIDACNSSKNSFISSFVSILPTPHKNSITRTITSEKANKSSDIENGILESGAENSNLNTGISTTELLSIIHNATSSASDWPTGSNSSTTGTESLVTSVRSPVTSSSTSSSISSPP